MKKFWDQYKVWIIIGGVVLLIVLFVVLYFVVLGKGQSQGVRKVLADIPNPDTSAPYTDDERRQIAQITSDLESVMSGFLWTSFWSNTQPFYDLSAATSRVQVGVYIQYKQDRPDQDLITDIQSLNSLNYDFSTMRTSLIQSLKNALSQ